MSDNLSPAVTHGVFRRQLEALHSTLSDDEVSQFHRAAELFVDMSQFFRQVTMATWGYFFPAKSVDPSDVSSQQERAVWVGIQMSTTTENVQGRGEAKEKYPQMDMHRRCESHCEHVDG